MLYPFYSTSSSFCHPNMDQAMCTRFRLILFLGSLFAGIWPGVLHAGQPEQMPQAPAASGFLLVASQQMADPRFRKTVILVSRHGNTGHVGVIVNRPQDITLDKIFPEYPAARKFSLFAGGPVFPEQISYLVRGADAVKGKRHYTDLRVVHGMASWAPWQLEREIKQGDWFVMPLDEADIFDRPPAEMWQELHRQATRIEI